MKNTIVIIFLACICAVCAGCSANVVPENENYVTDTKKKRRNHRQLNRRAYAGCSADISV